MSARWIGFLVFVWAIAAVIGSVTVGTNLFADANTTEPIQGIMDYSETWSAEGWGMFVKPEAHAGFFGDVFKIMTLNFPIFGPAGSPWQYIRWIILGPIIATVVFGMITLFASIFRRDV